MRSFSSPLARFFSLYLAVVFVIGGLLACTGEMPGDDAGDDDDGVEAKFASIQDEIFSPSCTATSCHDDDGPANDLSLTDSAYDRLVDVDSSVAGLKLVEPGDPDNSLLYLAVSEGHDDGNIRQMPPGVELSQDKQDAIKDWIADGAADN